MTAPTENGPALGLLVRIDPNAYANYAAFKSAVDANETDLITPLPDGNWSGGFDNANVAFATIAGARCIVDPDYAAYGELFFAEKLSLWMRAVIGLPSNVFDGVDLNTAADGTDIVPVYVRGRGVVSAKSDAATQVQGTVYCGLPYLTRKDGAWQWLDIAGAPLGASAAVSAAAVAALAGTLLDIRKLTQLSVDGSNHVTAIVVSAYLGDALLYSTTVTDSAAIDALCASPPAIGGVGGAELTFSPTYDGLGGTARLEVYDATVNPDPWSGGSDMPSDDVLNAIRDGMARETEGAVQVLHDPLLGDTPEVLDSSIAVVADRAVMGATTFIPDAMKTYLAENG